MDPRQRWQALQAHLRTSRLRFDERQYAAALAEIDAALAIDPDFLAAQSLRDRIMSMAPDLLSAADIRRAPLPLPATVEAVPAPQPVLEPPPSLHRNDSLPPPADLPLNPLPAAVALERPPVSSDGYARFEQRARRRRVDRRLEAARAALAGGRLKEAASALDEIIALDPNLPELPDLTTRYDRLRQAQHRPRAGRWLAAAAAFGAIVLGASWLQDATGLRSRQMLVVTPLVEPPAPFAVSVSASESTPEPASEPGAAAATNRASVDRAIARAADVTPAPDRTIADAREAVATEPRADIIPPAEPAARPTASIAVPQPDAPRLPPASAGPVLPLTNAVAATPPAPTFAAPAPVLPRSAPAAASAVARTPDDEAQINQVLQRYRSAYEGLDARSAHVVWPAVNEAALARAFDGLESQTLTFDACDVRLRGEAAAATCRGSARYVPKIGSREPRTEPLTWNFRLKKNGADWTIESARAAR